MYDGMYILVMYILTVEIFLLEKSPEVHLPGLISLQMRIMQAVTPLGNESALTPLGNESALHAMTDKIVENSTPNNSMCNE